MIETKGMAAMNAKESLKKFSFSRREPKKNDVVISIKYCGICHSDIHMVRNEWGEGLFPMVPGHEITGVVSRVGDAVTKYKTGDRVGVGCFVDSCRVCDNCKNDLDNYCLQGMTQTYGNYDKKNDEITQGGYSNFIVVDENYVLSIPDNISLDKAAPLLCAGITTYSPLMHWKAQNNKKVGVLGMGGLGHMAVQIAAALGAQVTVLSHSDKKKEDAFKLGAKNFLVMKSQDDFAKTARSLDLIINTVSSSKLDLASYFNLLKIDGTLVSVGAPEDGYKIHPFPLIMGRRSYAGSLIGSIKETQEMLNFCGKHDITPEIEVISPSYINEAFERVLKSDVRYRFVIDMTKI